MARRPRRKKTEFSDLFDHSESEREEAAEAAEAALAVATGNFFDLQLADGTVINIKEAMHDPAAIEEFRQALGYDLALEEKP
jgi:hypothetical protein